ASVRVHLGPALPHFRITDGGFVGDGWGWGGRLFLGFGDGCLDALSDFDPASDSPVQEEDQEGEEPSAEEVDDEGEEGQDEGVAVVEGGVGDEGGQGGPEDGSAAPDECQVLPDAEF